MSAGIKANNDGSGAIQIGGSDYITISSAGAVAIPQTLAVTGATTTASLQVGGVATNLYPLVSGTAITLTNQTAPDFTGIPPTAKRITVMFSGVSTNSTGIPLIQLGTLSGGYETTNYAATASIVTSIVASASYTTGFGLAQQTIASDTLNGSVVISLLNSATNTWTAIGNFGYAASRGGTSIMGGAKSLSGTLDRLRLYVDGTQQFDAGSINIMWE
jgi:hypothetical protein